MMNRHRIVPRSLISPSSPKQLGMVSPELLSWPSGDSSGWKDRQDNNEPVVSPPLPGQPIQRRQTNGDA